MQAIFNAVLTRLPSLVFGTLKLRWLRLSGARIGDRVRLGAHAKVLGPAQLVLGDDVSIAHRVTLDARGGLTVRPGALIGFETILLTYTHRSGDPFRPVHWQGVVAAPVVVGARTWLGARCIVMPGVTIGTSSIVGASSVVTRDVPEFVIAVGQPAKAVRTRSAQVDSDVH